MILCILLAAIAAAIMFWIIRPLIGLTGGRLAEDHAARAETFRAGLKALESDRAQAMIAAGEAGTERAALARALIAETDAADAPRAQPLPRWIFLVMAAALPVFALGIYGLTGMSQGKPSLMLYTERAKTEDLQRQLTQKLKERPDDPRGHRFMAMVEGALGHYGAAARHYGDAIALGDSGTEILTLYGEMLALDAGRPTEATQAAFDRALEQDPGNIRARLNRAEGRLMLGQYEGARDDMKAALEQVPADSPIAQALIAQIARTEHALKGGAAVPEDEDAQAAMIQGMVDGLAARLDSNPQDLAGWTRLIHSYAVLGQRDKAKAALAKAREVFAGNAQAQTALDGSAKGIE